MEGTSNLPPPAFFYPNLMSCMEIKILGTKTLASNDFMTATHEMRHFIDRAFLLSLNGGEELMAGCVTPTPPCHELGGTKSSHPERIRGMLTIPLEARVRVIDMYGASSKINVTLDHCLVVDSLPVPLHISVKALMNVAADKQTQDALCSAAQGRHKFKRESFPHPAYQTHPYWHNPKKNYLGKSESYAKWHQELMDDSATRNDQAERVVCHWCIATGKMYFCAKCKCARYCSRACQKAAWKEHKKDCNNDQ
mmetsp:Transcript_15570/g.26234  ORF Transcript_15570/g.26234 Transcript_15570/m.26234 type:complete len:252 (-) Transcript_15570:311-1066(-)|eukprot:CAMPEP_0198213320 /NCGR_PEP_ID=MMETSP1445-20131203/28800_1 /TAXON_ID=36898 /ORGANISM="Pyramimonas sp., Strain CCMP2087" /LENGTH=251 /DNA_ID=CAMNT_0043887945 /DNA_START=165 /DNA_END=920 /DNA_ORIENTATION=-